MTVLIRDTSTLLKGKGVVTTLPDGSQHFLSGENMAPPGVDYNPFFHDPTTGTMRDDIEHKWPLEALAEKMARGYVKNGYKLLDPLMTAKKMINGGHARFNGNHHDPAHHLQRAFHEETGELNPVFATSHTTPEYQHSRLETHERKTTTPDGQHANFFASAAPQGDLGQFAESGCNHAYREIAEEEEANGIHSGDTIYTKTGEEKRLSRSHSSHIEPGSMTNGQVYRHTSHGAGPGEQVPRAVQATQNQSRQLGSADPVNIIFGDGGKPKLPAKFFEKVGTGGAGADKVKGELEKYGIKDPQMLAAMSQSAMGQLLAGRNAGTLKTKMGELSERLDIEGENADLFTRIQSHIQRPTGWKGRGGKVAVNLAAMLRLADEIGDDLSDFGSWDKVAPGVVEGWQRIAPMVAQERGGSGESRKWGGDIPEQAHQSAATPQMPAISEGPSHFSELSPVKPHEPKPIQGPPAREPSMGEMAGMPPPVDQMAGMRLPMQSRMASTFTRSDDPTMRILLAMEEVQLASARKDAEIRKHLPTKRDLSVKNLSDVNLVANRLNLTSNDVIALYSAGGDWERVAKAFQVAPSVVGAVKVVFS